MIGSM